MILRPAHELAKTRLCAAHACGNDADVNSDLCSWCQRKLTRLGSIRMHVEPARLPDTLRCSSCNHWKIDEAFPKQPSKGAKNGRDGHRRGRHYECRECASKRRSTRPT